MNGVGTTARTGSNSYDPDHNGFVDKKDVAIDMPDVDTMTRQDVVDTRNEDVDDKIQFSSLKSSTPSSPITSPATSNSSPPSHRRSPVNTTSSSEDSSSSSYGLASSAGVSMFNPGYPTNIYPSTRNYHQYLSQPNTYYSTSSVTSSSSDSEKLRKLKQKKERKENRKEKNVLNTFKVEANVSDDSYNVDKVLQSLGEPPQSEKKGSRNNNNNNSSNNNKTNSSKSNGPVMNGNGSHNCSNGNNNQKNRRRSNEKQINDEDKKSTSDDEEDETASESGATASKVEISAPSRDYSSTVEFNHINEHSARAVVLVDESSLDLKRQVSRSTENLSSFTKVTKKQKRKKRPQDEPPPLQHQHQLQQRNGQRNGTFNRGGRPFIGGSGGSSSNGENISQESISPRDAATAAHAAAIRSALSQLPIKNQKSPLVQSQSVDDGALKWSTALATATSSIKTDLDLAADFPPLSDGPAGSEGFVSAPVPNVWPVFKLSTSDPLAVIETTSASEHTIQQAPPDLTVQANALPADFVAVTALPDVAAQTGPSTSNAATPPTPPASVCSSAPEDEPSKNVDVAPVDNNVVVVAATSEDESKTDVASYFVDNHNVEIVVSEKAYGHRDESTLPPVTIFCKGETPLEDWTSNGDFIFGYPVNEELLSMSFVETGELASQPSTEEDDEDGLNSASALAAAAATSLTLNQEDSAIVSFGESLDDLKVTVSPESGICLGGGGRQQQQQLDRSGRSTPQFLDSGASSWAEQVEDDYEDEDLEEEENCGGELHHQYPVKFNYQQILHFIRSSWLKVEAELAKETIRYYQPRQTNVENCC